ncbi:MAG: hypothetical protein ACFFAH_06550 [Promethearchaeota archaeon]
MVIYQMDLARFIQVYVVQVIIAAFFLFLAYKILKRGKKRLNLTFSGLYVFIALGLIVNCIYAPITDESVVLILNFITNFCVAFGLVFLTVFNLILLYSEKIITKKKEAIIISIHGALLMISIVFLPFGGVTINESTDWRPVFSLTYFIYFMLVITVMAAIPTLFTSFKIYREFEDKQLKKKWLFFIIGTIGLYIYMYAAFTANFLNIPTFRLILSFFGLTVVLWVYLTYYGVGRQLEE